MEWHLENRKVRDLQEWEGNPRIISKKGLKHLKESINRFGIVEPISITSDGVIIGGHGRKKALQALDIEYVDCYVLDKSFSEFEDYKELNIRLNRNIAGEFDIDMLANDYEIEDLVDWGFEEFDFGLGEEKELKEAAETIEEEGIIETCPHCGEIIN